MFTVNELLEATAGRLIGQKTAPEIRGISIDSRTIKPQEAFIAIKGNNFDGHNFIDDAIKKRASCIIKEKRTLPCRQAGTRQAAGGAIFIEVKDTIKALADTARFQREKFNIPVIAITGSNGKTTTKDMLAWTLSKKFKVLKNEGTKNNHIGLPLTLLNLNRTYDFVVLEVGTNHPGEVEYLAKIAQPNIGIITNIGPSHLEYFENLKGVFKEKYALTKHLKPPYIAILNADDALLKRQLIKKSKRPVVFGFGIKNYSDILASDIKILNDKIEFIVNRKYKFILKTLGYFNIYNALAAITVARILGMEYQESARIFATFGFPQSRLRFVEFNNIKFIDDTYNSNPISLKHALDTLDKFKVAGRKIFVMGDMLELGRGGKAFHCKAGYQVAKICDSLITVGNLSNLTAKAARNAGLGNENIFNCQSAIEAGDILFNKISPKPDDVVLVKGSRAMKMEEVFKI